MIRVVCFDAGPSFLKIEYPVMIRVACRAGRSFLRIGNSVMIYVAGPSVKADERFIQDFLHSESAYSFGTSVD
jgi:hypothetical protein